MQKQIQEREAPDMNNPAMKLAGVGLMFAVVAVLAAGCNKDLDVASEARSEGTSFTTVVVPGGTSIIATLDGRITTETANTGSAFSATTNEPIIVDGLTVFPSGSRVNGVLRDVEASGRSSGRARMTLAYQEIIDEAGKAHAISAQPLLLEADSGTGTDVERIAAGTVLGAIVGGIAGGGKGAAIGAGAGAGAGVIVMLATQGDELVLEAGQQMSVNMTSPTSVQVVAQN
jgi:hypothetical protein